ncbi:MAG: hypothetical protein IPI43_32300 [Sandaracinaceae bacterium]|nr:hypothetical protein [Sandaracinaceae bacterium]
MWLHQGAGTSDLFAGNRRLRRVRVRHPGGEVLATLNTEEQRLQRIPVTGEAGDYEIEILEWVAGARPTWRELCISEIRVGRGRRDAPRAAAPRCWGACSRAVVAAVAARDRRRRTLLEGDEGASEEGDDEEGLDDSEPANAAPIIAQRAAGLQITRLELAPEMDGRTPLGRAPRIGAARSRTVHCYFEPTTEPPRRHRGARPGGTSTVAAVALPRDQVAANRRFVIYRSRR